MPKIGRNEPCPCGSGKKYKYCCGKGDSKILSFPGVDLLTQTEEPVLPETTTYMERMGMPNMATNMFHDLQAELSQLNVKSEAELHSTIENFMNRKQTKGIDDFFGLSSNQMGHILYDGAEGMKGILELAGTIIEEDVSSIPILEEALFLLPRLMEEGGIKATTQGNLPRTLVLEAWEKLYGPREKNERLRELMKPNKEGNLRPLHELRIILRNSKLIKLYNKRYSISPKGKKLYEKKDLTSLYIELFKSTAWGFDWNEDRRDYNILHPLMQQSFIFNLYLLEKIAKTWTDGKKLVKRYLTAFPALYEAFGTLPEDANDIWMTGNIKYGLTNYPQKLGLLESRDKNPGEEFSYENEYRITPLFKRLLHWLI